MSETLQSSYPGGQGPEGPVQRDREARRTARTEFDRPVVLEAGAGTGKTSVLVSRVVSWCLGPGWSRAEQALHRAGAAVPAAGPEQVAARVVSRVVAITFTEAAAAEMASRVGQALSRLERAESTPGIELDPETVDPDLVRVRAQALLGAQDRLVVRTIHAFCRRLLAAYPLEAGLHPRFAIDADEGLAAQVVREVVEARFGVSPKDAGLADLLEIAGYGIGPRGLEEALVALLREGTPAAAFESDPFAPSRVESACARLGSALEGWARIESGRFGALRGRSSEVAQAVDAARRQLSALGGFTRDELVGLVEALTESWPEPLRERLRAWAGGRFNVTEQRTIPDAASCLARPSQELSRCLEGFLALETRLLDATRRVLRPLLDEVLRTLRRRGIETYAQLLSDARDLLVRRPLVAATVRAGIDQLLVDEFQDTDAVQCEIIAALALAGEGPELPGLFLVGDPKQSIYGWRNADLRAYDAFLERVRARRGTVQPLVVNFRSVPAILQEVERVIGPVMRERRGLQPGFQELVPSPEHATSLGFARGPFAPVEHWISWEWSGNTQPGSTTRSGVATELEARALARDLSALHRDQGVEWKDVGVLLRTGGDLEIYLRALRHAGVPFHVEFDRSYYRRREVIEAAALVRCVLDPHDHLALLTVLRSAWVGVPDAALIPLWSRDLPDRVRQLHGDCPELRGRLRDDILEVAACLDPGVPGIGRVRGWEQNLLAALVALGELRTVFVNEPGDVFAERLRTLTLFEATEAGRTLGAYRVANLDRFFRRLTEDLERSGGDREAVLAGLRGAISEAREADEGRPQEAMSSAVQIMTIHSAKGLDFEHVYVMQLHKETSRGRGSEASVSLGTTGEFEYRLFGAQTLGFDTVVERRRELEEAERVRTLYVAMTRARSRLVLAGRWNASGRATDSAVALVEQRQPGPPELAPLMADLAADSSDRRDAAGARWVFPGLAASQGAPRAAAPGAPVTFPDAAAARSASQRLLSQRAQARARMARPRSAPAAQAAHEALRDLFETRPEDDASGLPRDLAGADSPVSHQWSAGAQGAGIATAVGSAVHASLEIFDPQAPVVVELPRVQARAEAALRGLLGDDRLPEARTRVAELLQGFLAGPLLERLRVIAPDILARELPVLLPAQRGTTQGPVSFVSGVVDLVYRDSGSGEIVVADYKTDRVVSEAEVGERVDSYALQGHVYLRAVREAMQLPADPRFELWFLHPGRIERVGTG